MSTYDKGRQGDGRVWKVFTIYFPNKHRNYLRDLIDTTNVYLKMMEKFCQGSVMVQTKVKNKSKSKRKATKPKPPSKEEVLVRTFSQET